MGRKEQGLTFDDFLNTQLGGKVNRLGNWKKDNNGYAIVWIHTNSTIYMRLNHFIPFVVLEEDDRYGGEIEKIKFFNFVCHESTRIEQFYMYRNPAHHCPLCRLMEYIADNDDIDDSEIVWKATISGEHKSNRVLSKKQFSHKSQWKTAFIPKMEYIIPLINHEKPSDGIVISQETKTLGEKMRHEIKKHVERTGDENSDPRITPAAFKFTYDEAAGKKLVANYYDVMFPYLAAELTPEIQALLDEPEKDTYSHAMAGDTDKLREIMDAHVVLEIDLDPFFDNVHEEQSSYRRNDDVNPDEYEDIKTGEKKQPPKRGRGRPPKRNPPPKQLIKPDEKTSTNAPCPSCKGTGTRGGKNCPICKGTKVVDLSDVEDTPNPQPATQEKKVRKPAQELPAQPAQPAQPAEEMATCESCEADIPESATKCPHCLVDFQ